MIAMENDGFCLEKIFEEDRYYLKKIIGRDGRTWKNSRKRRIWFEKILDDEWIGSKKYSTTNELALKKLFSLNVGFDFK